MSLRRPIHSHPFRAILSWWDYIFTALISLWTLICIEIYANPQHWWIDLSAKILLLLADQQYMNVEFYCKKLFVSYELPNLFTGNVQVLYIYTPS